ncbi:MAG: proline racemase family protein [Gammaproteobacteria bacterium]
MAHFSHIISTIDTHAAGEPARIVLSGLPPILGNTMADKKRYMKERLDCFRTLLMQEPRGHKDMFGIILTHPTRQEADYGILFIDSEGYIDMCGHSIMSATTAIIETGMIPLIEPETRVLFDTPAGLIEAHARIEGQRVIEVAVGNVPSFLYARDVTIDLAEIGSINIDIAFGGNFFALVPADALGVTVHASQSRRLIELGAAVKKAVNAKLAVRHPTIDHITKVELTKIYEKPEPCLPYAKSVVIFGDGQLDRCPCGTGTSAIMAVLHAKGELPLETEYTNESIIGTQFKGKLLREIRLGDFVAVEPIVTGSAYITGMQQFVSNPNDPFKFGFLIDSG